MTDTVSMSKGESISLTKKAPGLTKVFAGAGWDVKKAGATMDLDLAAFMLDANGKLSGKGYFVYFGNKASACGSVASQGDNLTGAGDGDDEVVDVNLATVPTGIQEILFVASIYQAAQKGQSLKDLDNAFIRIVNAENQQELAKYDITQIAATGASFVLGKLVREGADWNFVAIGESDAGELGALATRFGLAVAA
ncbi:TerD family protein [Gemmata sp. G18]|uniref:TerD family protein n=1 Tax=Gemmata palustris TaxID=2822762 RepID=A0ABS5BPY7_9BACT|nr:TerD family protein [Gemmata palustris]MBP3955370.1 TerD family protein [Gemmata palustris]